MTTNAKRIGFGLKRNRETDHALRQRQQRQLGSDDDSQRPLAADEPVDRIVRERVADRVLLQLAATELRPLRHWRARRGARERACALRRTCRCARPTRCTRSLRRWSTPLRWSDRERTAARRCRGALDLTDERAGTDADRSCDAIRPRQSSSVPRSESSSPLSVIEAAVVLVCAPAHVIGMRSVAGALDELDDVLDGFGARYQIRQQNADPTRLSRTPRGRCGSLLTPALTRAGSRRRRLTGRPGARAAIRESTSLTSPSTDTAASACPPCARRAWWYSAMFTPASPSSVPTRPMTPGTSLLVRMSSVSRGLHIDVEGADLGQARRRAGLRNSGDGDLLHSSAQPHFDRVRILLSRGLRGREVDARASPPSRGR